MWSKFASFILRARVYLLALIVVITAFMAWKGTNVKMSYEFGGLLPEHDSTYIEYRKFLDNFSKDGNVVIIGTADENLYELDNFQAWYDLAKEFKSIQVQVPLDGEMVDRTAIDSVFSIAHSYEL
ncbi:MAG: hypothetical protein HRT74_14110, partial [Flavobacteriales bacterium]|nr:hypothetical protein [Flavobacteriales bacterium]